MIFIDTSVLVTYVVEKDSNHEKAVSIMGEIIKGKNGSAITSEYVFDETVTIVLVRSKSLESAIMWGKLIKKIYRYGRC
ncbi:MAG: PIN domain-containing protein [Cuniculiplasma sp.]